MAARLEHANICVSEIDEIVRFLQTAFPEFRVRGEGTGRDSKRWLHVGTDDTYIALMQANADADRHKPYSGGSRGVNHVAYEVDDVDALRARLQTGGYRESTPPNEHVHRKRVYFNDPDGNDWEFVQYLSQDPAERNDYELPDS